MDMNGNRGRMQPLTDTDIQLYRDDGYCIARGVFAPAEIAATLVRLEAFEATQAAGDRERLHAETLRYKPHLLFTWLDALVHDPRLLDLVEDFARAGHPCLVVGDLRQGPTDGVLHLLAPGLRNVRPRRRCAGERLDCAYRQQR